MDILKGELMMEMLTLENLKNEQKALQEKLGSEEYMAVRQAIQKVHEEQRSVTAMNKQLKEDVQKKGICRIIFLVDSKSHYKEKACCRKHCMVVNS